MSINFCRDRYPDDFALRQACYAGRQDHIFDCLERTLGPLDEEETPTVQTTQREAPMTHETIDPLDQPEMRTA